MFPTLIGTVVIAGIVGYASERSGFTRNGILPSIINTERNRLDMPEADFSTWVQPEEIANVAMFLASDAARAIHGALLPVEGLA